MLYKKFFKLVYIDKWYLVVYNVISFLLNLLRFEKVFIFFEFYILVFVLKIDSDNRMFKIIIDVLVCEKVILDDDIYYMVFGVCGKISNE